MSDGRHTKHQKDTKHQQMCSDIHAHTHAHKHTCVLVQDCLHKPADSLRQVRLYSQKLGEREPSLLQFLRSRPRSACLIGFPSVQQTQRPLEVM